jgi:outer membrane protein assembly factor BamB
MDYLARRIPVTRSQGIALGVGAFIVLLVALAVLALSNSSPGEPTNDLHGLGLPNGDFSNTRQAGGAISADTVSDLKQVWSIPAKISETFGSYAASPVVADGVIYQQDLASNVQAVALASGAVLWEKPYEAPTPGPNGLTVAEGKVFGATPTAIFALDRETGEELWSETLIHGRAERIEMAPGYHDGLVYVSTSTRFGRPGGVGTLWALNAANGKRVWSFNTVPKNLWGHPDINFGGGLSQTPAFDGQSIYFGVEGPRPVPGTERYPWGSSRPGPNLYTSSIVKLDAKSGKMRWYFQLTPHAVCLWGLQGPPVLTHAGGRNLVIAAGRAGVVIALDQRTGKLVWKRKVGQHNNHDNDGLLAMRGQTTQLKTPVTVFPGAQGGVAAPLSTDGSSVFVPVVNHNTRLTSQTKAGSTDPTTGELVTLDAANGAVRWIHRFPAGAFGATTVVNDVVFLPTLDGALYAFETKSGKQVWRTSLPAAVEGGGVTVSNDMVIVPAGFGTNPVMTVYRRTVEP